MMDKQDVNQKSTTIGWQAARGAERIRIATKILPVSIGVMAALSVFFVGVYFMLGQPWQWAWMLFEMVQAVVFLTVAYILARQGHLAATTYLTVITLNLTVVIGPALVEGMIVPGILASLVALVFAHLLAGRTGNRVVLFISAVALVTGISLSGFQVFEILSIPRWIQVITGASGALIVVSMVTLIFDLRDKQYEDSLSQTEAHARKLDAQQATLEERTRDLERRARYLEATAGVARDAASVLDPQELLSRVVTLVSEQLGFYHTGIFLLGSTGEWAVLQAASSEGGRRMLARGHRLRMGQEGIVSDVAGRGEPRIALDVGADAVFFDDPDLPETHSEMALPLRARGEIIGVLDVQSTESGAFSEEDVAVLQTLTDQVAMAISNARLFQQAQESLEAERRAYGELSREAWSEMVRARPGLGYRYDKGGVAPLVEHPGASQPGVRDHTGSQSKRGADGGEQRSEPVEELPELALPVRAGGHAIGTISAHKPGDAGAWTTEEVGLMETLADQLGVALESARLYEDAQRRAVRERLTREITDKMRRATGVEGIVQAAVDGLFGALGTSRTFVRLEAAPSVQDDGKDGT